MDKSDVFELENGTIIFSGNVEGDYRLSIKIGIIPIHIHLNIDLYELLEKFSSERKISKSDVIRLAIQKYITEETKEKITEKTMEENHKENGNNQNQQKT